MNAEAIARMNGWLRVLALVLPVAIAGLIAWGALRSDVSHLERVVANKADGGVVSVQYEAILRELQQVNRRLDGLERQR